MKTFSMTHIGRRREMNQDYMYTSENAVGKLPNLFLVADGMGGHKAGEYASRFTVEKIVETIETSGQTEPVAAMMESILSLSQNPVLFPIRFLRMALRSNLAYIKTDYLRKPK